LKDNYKRSRGRIWRQSSRTAECWACEIRSWFGGIALQCSKDAWSSGPCRTSCEDQLCICHANDLVYNVKQQQRQHWKDCFQWFLKIFPKSRKLF